MGQSYKKNVVTLSLRSIKTDKALVDGTTGITRLSMTIPSMANKPGGNLDVVVVLNPEVTFRTNMNRIQDMLYDLIEYEVNSDLLEEDEDTAFDFVKKQLVAEEKSLLSIIVGFLEANDMDKRLSVITEKDSDIEGVVELGLTEFYTLDNVNISEFFRDDMDDEQLSLATVSEKNYTVFTAKAMADIVSRYINHVGHMVTMEPVTYGSDDKNTCKSVDCTSCAFSALCSSFSRKTV